MRNGSQFHDLRYFVNAEYAKAHKTITLTTILGETEWEVFSAYSVSTEFDYIRTDFSPARPFGSFLADIKARSLIDMGNEAVDRVLTLSTCTNTADDMRYAVHARLVSED
jgi:sortase B